MVANRIATAKRFGSNMSKEKRSQRQETLSCLATFSLIREHRRRICASQETAGDPRAYGRGEGMELRHLGRSLEVTAMVPVSKMTTSTPPYRRIQR